MTFLALGLFLSIFMAPFMQKEAELISIWQFNYNLWLHLCLTIIISFILIIGISFVCLSILNLFEFNFIMTVNKDLFLIIGTVFLPIMFTSGIPNRFSGLKLEYSKAIPSILKLVILPFLLLYSVILYLYAIKIMVMWDFPKGKIVYFVFSYGLIGIMAYLASYPFRKELGIFSFFYNHFFKIFMIPLLLMLIAIGIRIYEYGITEPRYIVCLCCVWFFLSTVFSFFNREKATKWIFMSMICLLNISAVGIWFIGPWRTEVLSKGPIINQE
jgi:hypothetical protein